jgi:hypothetical protein
LLTVQELKGKYPKTFEYLLENRKVLESREHGTWKHDRWYAYSRSQNLSAMEQKKIMTPSIANSASFTLDLKDLFYFVGSGGGGGGGYGITIKDNVKVSYQYILALLNSQLLDTYLKSFSSQFSGGFYAYSKQYIEKLPIYLIDFNNPSEKAIHDKLISLVDRMLELHKKKNSIPPSAEREKIEREIAVTDEKIDEIVYELYGITEKERKLIKGK